MVVAGERARMIGGLLVLSGSSPIFAVCFQQSFRRGPADCKSKRKDQTLRSIIDPSITSEGERKEATSQG